MYTLEKIYTRYTVCILCYGLEVSSVVLEYSDT